MIEPMLSRTTLRYVLITLVALLAVPGIASAQAQWDDAPADDSGAMGDEMVPYDDTDPAALVDFNTVLEPNGAWRDDATYGRVWIPHRHIVGPDFAPYVTSGHWAVADDGGWLWVSDYSWGWAVFHYGRWVWVSGVGWAWVPGRRYANAWVTWRVAEPGWDYVGWAPMPPDYVWFNGFAVGVGFSYYTPWVFCPSAYVYHSHMHGYVVHDHYQVQQIAAHSHRYSSYRGSPRWAGPSAQAAHIPAKAVPKKHTPAHPKAVAASKQKASERHAKIVASGGRVYNNARRVPGGRPGSRTLPGTSDTPLRSYRRAGPGAPDPAARGPAQGGPSRAYRGGAPPGASRPRYGAPQRQPPAAGASPPSRSPRTANPSPPAPRPSNGARSPSPRIAPPPVPAPSSQPAPAAPSRRGRGGGRR
ncbi:MAG: hypothetical protein IPI67_20520 [Myxococcales bacterium]|nr:hypothetical protein [Myxococcales bacterium]